MSLRLELSDTEIVLNSKEVLYQVHMLISQRRHELGEKVKNKKITVGDFQGTIVSIDAQGVLARSANGTEKVLSLNRQRIRQLLA